MEWATRVEMPERARLVMLSVGVPPIPLRQVSQILGLEQVRVYVILIFVLLKLTLILSLLKILAAWVDFRPVEMPSVEMLQVEVALGSGMVLGSGI